MEYFPEGELQRLLDFPSLIAALEQAFRDEYTVPQRHHYQYKNPAEEVDSTLLLMPAWKSGSFLGVKLVTVSPRNSRYDLPSIHGIYTLFDAHKGQPLVQMEGKMLTALRTAAASALAAKFLSRKDSKILLMVGTGALAPQLIRAHATVRPIEQVFLWGRNPKKAAALASQMSISGLEVVAVEDLAEFIPQADIVSCATLSPTPLIRGEWLHPGQHLDLVGSYLPTTREADDETIRRSSVYVDTLAGATKESGDIVIPLQTGVLTREEIRGDLFSLCRGLSEGPEVRLGDHPLQIGRPCAGRPGCRSVGLSAKKFRKGLKIAFIFAAELSRCFIVRLCFRASLCCCCFSVSAGLYNLRTTAAQ